MENVDYSLEELLILHQPNSELQPVVVNLPALQQTGAEGPLHWTRPMTLSFIEEYENCSRHLEKFRTQKAMFVSITETLNKLFSTNLSWTQVLNKYKSLERSYKEVKDNNNATGRRRKDFEFEEQMDRVLGKRRNVSPVILLEADEQYKPRGNPKDQGSQGTGNSTNAKCKVPRIVEVEEQLSMTPQTEKPSTPQRVAQLLVNDDEMEEELGDKITPLTPHSSHRRRRALKTRVDVLQDIRNDRREYVKFKRDIQERRLANEQRITEAIEKKNLLAEKKIALLEILLTR